MQQLSGREDAEELLSMPRVVEAMQRMQHPDPMAAELRNTRITTKDLWSLSGSAIGEEAMDMAKKKAEERQLKEAGLVEERRVDKESKRRRDLTEAVKRSKELLEQISCQGPSRLSTMAVKDLKALLLYHRPDGTADSKGSKAELQSRVAFIPDVVQALSAYAPIQEAAPAQDHARVDPPPVSPPMPPPRPPMTDPAPLVPPEMLGALLSSVLGRCGLPTSSTVAPFQPGSSAEEDRGVVNTSTSHC